MAGICPFLSPSLPSRRIWLIFGEYTTAPFLYWFSMTLVLTSPSAPPPPSTLVVGALVPYSPRQNPGSVQGKHSHQFGNSPSTSNPAKVERKIVFYLPILLVIESSNINASWCNCIHKREFLSNVHQRLILERKHHIFLASG